MTEFLFKKMVEVVHKYFQNLKNGRILKIKLRAEFWKFPKWENANKNWLYLNFKNGGIKKIYRKFLKIADFKKEKKPKLWEGKYRRIFF